ncbi:MAG: PAS domain S-box protein [Betaproteobacteria bacterium]|nr:PAS domain S-box protein [Betaproteobacteria bacterium]
MPKGKQLQRARGEEEAAAPLDAAFKLVDALPVPVFFKSRDGRYLGVNRAWEEFFGIRAADFIGRQVVDLYPHDPAIAERHAAMDRELYAGPGRQSYEITVRARDGELRDTLYYKATYTDVHGVVAGLIGTIIDITARKSAESALRDNQERWHAIVNSANEGILVYDRNLDIVAGNQAAERILGIALAELIGVPGFTSRLPCVDAHGRPLPPEDRPTRVTVRTGKPLTGHVMGIERAEGVHTWLLINTAFLRQPDASDWYGVVSSFTDITAQRNAEAALRGSEERYRRTFELARSGLAQVGLDGRFLRVNRRLCEFFGRSEAELVGTVVKDLSHPEDRDALDERRARLLAGEVDSVRVEKRYLHKDGGTIWASIAIALERDASGMPLYAISVLEDVTAQKQVEEALRQSEARYRRTFELAGSGIAHIGLDRRFIRVNRRLCEILGYPEEELIGMTGREISHPDDLEVINTQRSRLYASEIDHVRLEKRYLRKDRSTVWVTFSMVLERSADGTPLYEIAIFDDITERKRGEQALRESEARFRSLTQLSSDWYWEQDESFGLTFMSGRMGERTGLEASAYLGRKRWDQPALNVTAEDWARHRAVLERHEAFRDFEMERPNPAGGTRWISVTGEPVYDDAGHFRGYRGVGSDITARKRAEAELRRAHDELARKAEELQRSNAELEQFAYVASHDLQEPLRMVSSYTQLLARRYSDKLDGDAREFMNYVVDGAARMKQLIEDLLAYSRVGTKGKEFKPVSLEAPLKRAVTNLRAAIEESGAAVSWDSLPRVDVDEVQLVQLFQNLIGNALKFRGQAPPRIHVSAQEENAEWRVSIADNGIGIEPQYFERIFMLFQRLHTMGEYPGTGIGLAICKKVAERHGGRIWLESQLGAGSTFHFTLPKKDFP